MMKPAFEKISGGLADAPAIARQGSDVTIGIDGGGPDDTFGLAVLDDAEIDAIADRVGDKVREKLEQQQAAQSAAHIVDTIAEIRAHYRELRYLIKTRIAAGNRLGGYIRLSLGWRKDLEEKERGKIAKAAALAIKERDPRFAEIIDLASIAFKASEAAEHRHEVTLRKLAASLPVWETFGAPILGFGPLGLAVIIGEAGNLSDYDDFPKLWKRLGLGMVGDRQQGRPGAHATAADHIEHGYNKERRAAIYAYIWEPLLKKDNIYRAIYLRRKEYEAARGKTKMHSHRAAHRYAEKMLVKHLWQAWRAADQIGLVEMTNTKMSAARPKPFASEDHQADVEMTIEKVSSLAKHPRKTKEAVSVSS